MKIAHQFTVTASLDIEQVSTQPLAAPAQDQEHLDLMALATGAAAKRLLPVVALVVGLVVLVLLVR